MSQEADPYNRIFGSLDSQNEPAPEAPPDSGAGESVSSATASPEEIREFEQQAQPQQPAGIQWDGVTYGSEQEFMARDPLGHAQASNVVMSNRLAASEQRENERAFTSEVASQIHAFKQDHPDYGLAVDGLMESRASELKNMGYTEHQVNQVLNSEAASMAAQAMQTGRNPGELVMALAKSRGVQLAVEKLDDKSFDRLFDQMTENAKAEGWSPGVRK